jgi:hypothetical protein
MPDQVLQNVTRPSGNGHDTGLDPKIVKMVDFLDRAIKTQNPTVGTVIAACGVLLGRKGMNPDNLERLIHDVTTAIRVGFYLHSSKGK